MHITYPNAGGNRYRNNFTNKKLMREKKKKMLTAQFSIHGSKTIMLGIRLSLQ